MTIRPAHYYVDKDKNMSAFITGTTKGIFFSIHSIQTDSTVFIHNCDKTELKDLADFIYTTIGEKE